MIEQQNAERRDRNADAQTTIRSLRRDSLRNGGANPDANQTSSSTQATGTAERSRLQDVRRRLAGRDGQADRAEQGNRDVSGEAGRSASTDANGRGSGLSRRNDANGVNSLPGGLTRNNGASPNDPARNRISDARRRLDDNSRQRNPSDNRQLPSGAADAAGAGDRHVRIPSPDARSDEHVRIPEPDEHLADTHRPHHDGPELGIGSRPRNPGPGGESHLVPPTGVKPRPVDRPPDQRFHDRVKSGDLNHLVAGETAKKLKLDEQYKLARDGDIARRMDLEKHAHDLHRPDHPHPGPHIPGMAPANLYEHHPSFYHGPLSPHYVNRCVSYRYWGPSFFVGVWWYPRWDPWVEWSWHHHCHPYWDPRPVYCRPVIYDPCPVWVAWDVPVWQPLPEVSCGTWVDLKVLTIDNEKTDLQLVAVRFVDPGHPEENLGPRYRVWFRNVGNQPITHPFDVALFAANDGNLVAGLPQAGVRVTSIEANDVQSVDIRLPASVLAMGPDADGKPSPFTTLHVLVDANREVAADTERVNNGARLAPAEVLPVDPAAFELEPSSAAGDSEVLLAGEGFGPQPGQVIVNVNGQELEAEILGWYDLGVRFTLPKVAVQEPTEAEVVVVRGDGAASNPLKIVVEP